MVRFTDKGFVIEYDTVCPIEEWSGLLADISYVFTMMHPENTPVDGLWCLAKLIEAMVPTGEVADRMLRDKIDN